MRLVRNAREATLSRQRRVDSRKLLTRESEKADEKSATLDRASNSCPSSTIRIVVLGPAIMTKPVDPEVLGELWKVPDGKSGSETVSPHCLDAETDCHEGLNRKTRSTDSACVAHSKVARRVHFPAATATKAIFSVEVRGRRRHRTGKS